MTDVDEEAQRREDEALAVLRRGRWVRWAIVGGVVVVAAGWFAWRAMRPPCEPARVEICRKLMVSCARTTAGMERDAPSDAWCEPFLDADFIEERGRAAGVVLQRYPEAELTEAERAQLREMGARGRYSLDPVNVP